MLKNELVSRELDASWREVTGRLQAFIQRRVHSADVAADLVQEVLLRAQRHQHSIPNDQLEPWLFRIARNLVIDHYRKARSQNNVSLVVEPLHEESQASALAHVSGCVKPMLNRLPDDYRHALEQTDLGERTQAELARDVGLSLAGAKSRVQRARAQLGEAIRHCCAPEVDATGTMIDHACTCQPPHYCREKAGRCGSA